MSNCVKDRVELVGPDIARLCNKHGLTVKVAVKDDPVRVTLYKGDKIVSVGYSDKDPNLIDIQKAKQAADRAYKTFWQPEKKVEVKIKKNTQPVQRVTSTRHNCFTTANFN